MRRGLQAIILALATTALAAEDRYLLVGGGPTPKETQVSIEWNTLWIQRLLQKWRFSGGQTWFGAGNDGIADVAYRAEPDDTMRYREPLARVFDDREANRQHFRPNEIDDNLGPFSRANVETALTRDIERLKAGDSLFIVYAGHGSWARDRASNALRLLDDTHFSAAELARKLEGAPPDSSVRYLTPQCFSGAFMRSIFRAPSHPRPQDAMPSHCGFAAVSEDHESEGCTVSIEVADYRDYATYFFAALDGETRLGEPLSIEPDRDDDGTVTLLEAHYYAYTEAQSTDVPRATSEYLLDLAQPWYARWLPRRTTPDNPYRQLAERLEERLHLASPSASQLRSIRAAKKAELEAQRLAQRARQAEEKSLREQLATVVKQRWPEAETAWPEASPANQGTTIDALGWLGQQDDYQRLAELQDEIDDAKLAILKTRREEAQIAKLQRARRLAVVYERRSASVAAEHVEALRACESWTPPMHN